MSKRWYIVHAYSNFENKVAQSIKDQAAQRGLTELFDEVMVLSEDAGERTRRGQLLRKLADLFGPLADFGVLSTTGASGDES